MGLGESCDQPPFANAIHSSMNPGAVWIYALPEQILCLLDLALKIRLVVHPHHAQGG